MDSMAVYRGMDRGTAKPTAEERDLAPHHLVDLEEPAGAYSVARWLEDAARVELQVRARGRRVLYVGGTPLYLKALLHGLDPGPGADWTLRRRILVEAHGGGAEALHRRLADLDPASARRVHPRDLRRVVRALEVHALTGRPASEARESWGRPPRGVARLAGLRWERGELYRRIDRRVEAMFAAGLVEEVRLLVARHGELGREAGQALGYREVLGHLAGGRGLAETVEQVQRRTRQFARRQLTWLARFPVRWLDCRAGDGPWDLARLILADWDPPVPPG